ncbi:uncharacterized protein LOC143911731 [Arctopsyche grandis]|uniref:uncharacterized protein LOC143911731 n=1 Tax=Arctopsyche grandis TaxID=121162 RepID=UPI00406D9F60
MLSFKLLFRFQGKNCNFIQTRCLYESHYDVLSLKKDCTTKDVRNSFIGLSKKFHPDKSNNRDSHAKYLQILEAYKVLSNRNRRAEYDLNFSNTESSYTVHTTQNVYSTYYAHEYDDPVKRAWKDPSFYANRHKTQYGETHNSKYVIVVVILTFISLIVIVYSLTLWHLFQEYKTGTDTESAKNAAYLELVRSNAREKNIDQQIHHVLSKMKD